MITLWTYYEPLTALEISPVDYADALERLHVAMRTIDFQTPHFTDRVEEALQLVAERDARRSCAEDDRELLATRSKPEAKVTERGATSCCTASRILATY